MYFRELSKIAQSVKQEWGISPTDEYYDQGLLAEDALGTSPNYCRNLR